MTSRLRGIINDREIAKISDFIKDHYPEQFGQLEAIRAKNSNLQIIILDFSFNQGFPVVALLVCDRLSKTYKLQVGAHPRFDIALERCCTEFLQGFDISDQNVIYQRMSKFIPEANWRDSENWFDLMDFGHGNLPLSLLGTTPSWEFKPWGDIPEYTSKKGLKILTDLTFKYHSTVFVRDTGFLGFPAYMLYVPQFSLLPIPRGFNFIEDSKLRGEAKKYLFSNNLYNPQLAEFLVQHPDAYLDVSDNSPEKADSLTAAFLFESGYFPQAQAKLEKLAQQDPKYQGLLLEIKLIFLEKSDSDRDKIISFLYGNEILQYIKIYWRQNLLQNIKNRALTATVENPAEPPAEVVMKLTEKISKYSFDSSYLADII